MMCPHCGKETDQQSTAVNLNLANNNACNPVLATFIPNVAGANPVVIPQTVNLAANGCNPYPQVTYIKI